jgi:hypothetical protein
LYTSWYMGKRAPIPYRQSYLPVRTLVCAVCGTYLGVCQPLCEQILLSDYVDRFCLLNLSKYFYRAVCKNNTRMRVGD